MISFQSLNTLLNKAIQYSFFLFDIMTEIQMRKPHSIEAEKVASNGTKFYLIKWEGQNDPSQFSWIPENEFDPDSEIVARFLSSNLEPFADEITQTDESIWVFNQPPKAQEFDYFQNYVTKSVPLSNSKNCDDLIPTNIINYDSTNKTFETLFADMPDPKWIESDILLSLAPDLVAKFFIDREKNKDQ